MKAFDNNNKGFDDKFKKYCKFNQDIVKMLYVIHVYYYITKNNIK
jgi:hypothetical protein